MTKIIPKKVRILSYALVVLLLGAVAGWIGGPGSSVKRVGADYAGDGGPSDGTIGDGPASGCPSPSDCCA